ncbi:MAG: hypothetical protein RLW62_01250 [Gammaproteobacteria bacterium]
MMMIERLRDALLCCALVFAAMAAPHATAEEAADEPVEFSEAETRMWMTDQLKAVDTPMTLRYSFTRSGSLEPGFEDEVRFVIDAINEDGTKGASVQFFTGERQFPVPPVSSTDVNPILKVYLQGDVYEMNRLTDPEGSARERWRYFQRRVKLALAESATVTPHTFEFSDREWQGHEIRFAPYVNDPKRDLFERFADKTYRVIVSDELPGYVYRVETVIPSAGEAEEPLIREVMQLEAIERAN